MYCVALNGCAFHLKSFICIVQLTSLNIFVRVIHVEAPSSCSPIFFLR